MMEMTKQSRIWNWYTTEQDSRSNDPKSSPIIQKENIYTRTNQIAEDTI